MAGESLATGYGLVNPSTLYTAWTDNIVNGEIFGKLHFGEDDLFDVLRGWPIEGAINNFIELADPTVEILRGTWVMYNGSGLLIVGEAPADTAPVKLMMALDNSTSTSVVASGYRLPVLTTHFVARIPSTRITGDVTDYALGAPVTVAATGFIDYTVTNLQIIGTVRGRDIVRGTVDIEVN